MRRITKTQIAWAAGALLVLYTGLGFVGSMAFGDDSPSLPDRISELEAEIDTLDARLSLWESGLIDHTHE